MNLKSTNEHYSKFPGTASRVLSSDDGLEEIEMIGLGAGFAIERSVTGGKLCLTPYICETQQSAWESQVTRSSMFVVHMVMFKIKASLSEAEVKEVCADMLALRNTCVHPSSNKPYIVQSSGGKDNSPEGLQGGFTHGFVVEFASPEDRDYYVKDDPSHLAFVKKHESHLEDVKVIDYTKGVY